MDIRRGEYLIVRYGLHGSQLARAVDDCTAGRTVWVRKYRRNSRRWTRPVCIPRASIIRRAAWDDAQAHELSGWRPAARLSAPQLAALRQLAADPASWPRLDPRTARALRNKGLLASSAGELVLTNDGLRVAAT
jgi:hypothetical protein